MTAKTFFKRFIRHRKPLALMAGFKTHALNFIVLKTNDGRSRHCRNAFSLEMCIILRF